MATGMHWISRWFAWLRRAPDKEPSEQRFLGTANAGIYPGAEAGSSFEVLYPYDEALLERSRTQWQFGDWASLAAINRDSLEHHPDRAKLALLAAAGHHGLGNAAEARLHAHLAIDWGCSKKLISQILIAGVHNSLGRAAALSGQRQRAIKHFQASLESGSPGCDIRLLTQARVGQQLAQLGMPGQAIQIRDSANESQRSSAVSGSIKND